VTKHTIHQYFKRLLNIASLIFVTKSGCEIKRFLIFLLVFSLSRIDLFLEITIDSRFRCFRSTVHAHHARRSAWDAVIQDQGMRRNFGCFLSPQTWGDKINSPDNTLSLLSLLMSLLAQEKLMIRPKVVVALYPFKAIEGDDLSLERVSCLTTLF
jgi:hypothetical protein